MGLYRPVKMCRGEIEGHAGRLVLRIGQDLSNTAVQDWN
jgi:hypothetical protein